MTHKTISIHNNELYFENFKVSDIANKYGTPIYVYSENRIQENYKKLFHAFHDHYNNFKIHYAIKANTNLRVLKILKDLGSGADCSNINEVKIAMHAGFAPDEILYTGNYNSKEDLIEAARLGVTINIDDISLLDAFDKNHKPKILCFRLNPGMGYGKFDKIITAGPNAKFGIPETDIFEAYRRAKKLGVTRFGLHMMTGSCVLKPEYFKLTTHKLFKIATKISKKLGIDLEFINIGGGFGIPYSKKEKELDVRSVASLVVSELKRVIKKNKLKTPRLLIEPGRFLVGDSGILIAKVNAIKHSGKKFIGIDAGMNTLLRPALYKAYHEIIVAENSDGAHKEKVNVCGQVCENTDIFAKDRSLPNIKIGNHLVFMNAGAYGFAMSSQYNNFLRPAELLISDKKIIVIRKKETFVDLIRNQ